MSRLPGLRLLRTLAGLVAALLVASVIVFALLRLLPGDVATVIGGDRATDESLAAIRASLGLDRPLPVQYLDFLGNVVTGDLGTSPVDGTSIGAELWEKAQVTVPLALGGLLLALLLAVPLGVVAALRDDTRTGTAISVLGQLGLALPTLWVGLMLVLLLSVGWGLLPAQGFPLAGWDAPADALRSLVLPWITIALAEGAILLRYVRSATLAVLAQDHIRTARANGHTRAGALVHHGLRNASLPVVSVLGLQAAGLVASAVVVERVFTLPGIGRMLLADVGNRDLAKVQVEVLALTAAVLVISAAVDALHTVLDPRLRTAR